MVNELFATTLRELVANNELVIDTGNIDETPPVYLPLYICTIKNTAHKGS